MKRRSWRRFGIAAALVLVSAALPAQRVFITQDGAPRAAIVYPRELSNRMDQAVSEFRLYIRDISGTEVQLRRDPDPGFNSLHLCIQESGDPIPDVQALSALNREGFIIRVADGEAWLCGRSELGLQHAMYWLLEQWGCRWLFPGEAGEVVPDSPTLLLDQGMQTDQQPHFLMRQLWYNYGSYLPEGPKRDLRQWVKRNRLEHSFYGGIGHAYRKFVSHRDRELFSAHPEYYPRLFGFRVRRGQICTGNLGVRVLAVRYALDYFRDHPEHATVSLSPNDGAGP